MCTSSKTFIYSFHFYPGNSEDALVPTLVSGLKGHHVIDVACGSGDAQTLAVTKDGKSSLTLCMYNAVLQV